MFVNSLIYFNLFKSIIPLILCFGIHILFIFCFEIEMTIVIIPELAHQFLFKITKFVVQVNVLEIIDKVCSAEKQITKKMDSFQKIPKTQQNIIIIIFLLIE